MQNRAFKTSLVCLTLLVFLVTLAGNAFGYAWCFGSDHSKIEQVTPAGCAGKGKGCAEFFVPQPAELTRSGHDQDGACSDVLLSEGDAILGKRSVKPFKVDFDSRVAPVPSSSFARYPLQLQTIDASPRVSQAMLAHRTVVLLH